MNPEPGLHSSPPTQRLIARLSWLGLFLCLLWAGQGCGNGPADKTAKFLAALENSQEAGLRQNYDLAIADFSEAIRLKPDDFGAYYYRGLSYDLKGNYDRAIADYNDAIRLKPDYVVAYNNRGLAYHQQGDDDKAIADETEAIRLNPHFLEAYNTRGVFYDHKGSYDKALADYNEAIRLKPDFVEAYINLASLLAVCPDARVRNGEKAVAYATKACELSEWKTPAYLSTLAAAYAEAGHFDDAVKWQNEYLVSNSSKDDWDKARQRLTLYEGKKPYHEEKP